MLWASTKFVGCASDFYVEGSDRVYYLLCRYSTPADLWNLIERLNNLPVAKPGIYSHNSYNLFVCSSKSRVCIAHLKNATPNHHKLFYRY